MRTLKLWKIWLPSQEIAFFTALLYTCKTCCTYPQHCSMSTLQYLYLFLKSGLITIATLIKKHPVTFSSVKEFMSPQNVCGVPYCTLLCFRLHKFVAMKPGLQFGGHSDIYTSSVQYTKAHWFSEWRQMNLAASLFPMKRLSYWRLHLLSEVFTKALDRPSLVTLSGISDKFHRDQKTRTYGTVQYVK